MASTYASPDNIPDVLTCKMTERDKPVFAEISEATGLTNTSEFVRFCMRAAQREIRALGRAAVNSDHQPINPG